MGTFDGKPVVLVGVERGAAQLRDFDGRVVVELPTAMPRPYGALSDDGRTIVVSSTMQRRVHVFTHAG